MSKTEDVTTKEGMLSLAQWVREELGGGCHVEHCAVAPPRLEKELPEVEDRVYWICWLPGNVVKADNWVDLFNKVVDLVKGRKAVENENEGSEGVAAGGDEG